MPDASLGKFTALATRPTRRPATVACGHPAEPPTFPHEAPDPNSPRPNSLSVKRHSRYASTASPHEDCQSQWYYAHPISILSFRSGAAATAAGTTACIDFAYVAVSAPPLSQIAFPPSCVHCADDDLPCATCAHHYGGIGWTKGTNLRDLRNCEAALLVDFKRQKSGRAVFDPFRGRFRCEVFNHLKPSNPPPNFMPTK